MSARPGHRRETISMRLSPDLKRRLEAAVNTGPYRITMTSIIERGMKLALDELDSINAPNQKEGR